MPKKKIVSPENPDVEIKPENAPDTIKFLQRPDLFERLQKELDKKIVGEYAARHCILLNSFGRLVINSNNASYNLLVNSKSGAGKDHIANAIMKLMPKAVVHKRTRISATAFTYWHHGEKDWTWDGKICYLQDISDAVLNSDVFKVMVTDGSFATVVKDQKAIDIEIKGKPVMIITAANVKPANEMLRRFPIVNLDETPEQTNDVINLWLEDSKYGGRTEYDKEITRALARLDMVKVVIPFAPIFKSVFNVSHVIMRTNVIRFMDLIKASAALHQYQREVTDIDTPYEGIANPEPNLIIANKQDYECARIAFMASRSNELSLPLTHQQKRFMDVIRKLHKDMKMENFKATFISSHIDFLNERNVYRYLEDMREDFFDVEQTQDVTVDRDGNEKRQGKPYFLWGLKEVYRDNDLGREVAQLAQVLPSSRIYSDKKMNAFINKAIKKSLSLTNETNETDEKSSHNNSRMTAANVTKATNETATFTEKLGE